MMMPDLPTWHDRYPLFHYAAEPFALCERFYSGQGRFKPSGLWVSDDTDHGWPHWCRDEGFALSRLGVRYSVRLARPESILHLGNAADLLAFHRAFPSRRAEDDRLTSLCLDWEAVAARWAGIIITPYLWSLRFHDEVRWYYAWDCASGCIWDLSAIEGMDVDDEWRVDEFLRAERAPAD